MSATLEKPVPLADGLYQVTTPHLCAAFVIENGQVTECAPILRRRLSYWMTVANRVDTEHSPET